MWQRLSAVVMVSDRAFMCIAQLRYSLTMKIFVSRGGFVFVCCPPILLYSALALPAFRVPDTCFSLLASLDQSQPVSTILVTVFVASCSRLCVGVGGEGR